MKGNNGDNKTNNNDNGNSENDNNVGEDNGNNDKDTNNDNNTMTIMMTMMIMWSCDFSKWKQTWKKWKVNEKGTTEKIKSSNKDLEIILAKPEDIFFTRQKKISRNLLRRKCQKAIFGRDLVTKKESL